MKVVVANRARPKWTTEAKSPWAVEEARGDVWLVQRRQCDGRRLRVVGPFDSRVAAERHLVRLMQTAEDEPWRRYD